MLEDVFWRRRRKTSSRRLHQDEYLLGQSDTSIVILPVGRGRSTVILNSEDYLEKCLDHIDHGLCQLL